MKDFLLLFSIYRSITRRSMGAAVYMAASAWKYPLWLLSAIIVALCIWVWFSNPWHYQLIALTVAFSAWGLFFNRMRRSAFQQLYSVFPEQMEHYSHDYQFIRYRHFVDKLKNLPEIKQANVLLALDHAKTELETQPNWSVSSHPLVVGLLGAFFAILGGAAGRWEPKYLVFSLCSLAAVVYFSYMVLGLVRTRKSNLLEFKRFLHWASNELE